MIFSRVFSGIFAGICAGVLDLKGLEGFILLVVTLLVTTFIMFIQMKMNLSKYFYPSSLFLTTSLWDSIMSFVLFWTFLSNVLYLYG